MRVRITAELGQVWRPGEVIDLPADTAKALALAGYAEELPMPTVGGPGGPGPTDILVPDHAGPAEESEL